MIKMMKSEIASIPYAIQLKQEKYYQLLMYLLFRMCGMNIVSESMTNIGRLDAVLKAGNNIYIIECKIDKSAEEALKQINDNKYAEQYYNDMLNGCKIIKVGMNFSSDKDVRNIDKYLVEQEEYDDNNFLNNI